MDTSMYPALWKMWSNHQVRSQSYHGSTRAQARSLLMTHAGKFWVKDSEYANFCIPLALVRIGEETEHVCTEIMVWRAKIELWVTFPSDSLLIIWSNQFMHIDIRPPAGPYTNSVQTWFLDSSCFLFLNFSRNGLLQFCVSYNEACTLMWGKLAL